MYTQIDKTVRDQLLDTTFAVGLMGSHAHGLHCEGSDRDILYLYYDKDFGKGIPWESNGWQFKNGNIDENYQEIRAYIRNLIIGESPADFEALRRGFVFRKDPFVDSNSVIENKFYDIMKQLSDNCHSYALVKAYLGYLKKDSAAVAKMYTDNCPLESMQLRKRLAHMIRGMSTISHLLDPVSVPYQFDGDPSVRGDDWLKAKTIKCHGVIDSTRLSIMAKANAFEERIRAQLNAKLNDHTINRRMPHAEIAKIDAMVLDLIDSIDKLIMIKFERSIDFGDLQYRIIESGATFQYK